MIYRIACALLFAFSTLTTFADDQIEDLEVITVSATPITIDAAGSAVTVISRRQILERNAATIAELLRDVPGFAVSQLGSLGSQTQLRVRGSEANQVMVMINGIEANDPSQGSEFEFSQLTTADIERIEVIRGAQSALWGSDAMAGVINIITTPSQADQNVQLLLESGSFSTNRASIVGQTGYASGQVKLTVDYLDTDGTNISRSGSEDDGLENLTASLSGYYQPSDNFRVDYTARYTDKTAEFDGSDFITTGLPIDADNETDSEYLYSGLKLSHDINETFSHALSLSLTDTDNETDTGGAVNDIQRGKKTDFRYQLNAMADDHRLSLVAERENEEYTQRGQASFFGDPNHDRETQTDSLAAEYRYDTEQFNFSASARQDKNDDFDDANAWRISGVYHFEALSLYASVGESIKNPTFTERFGFFTNFIGNPDLKPESAQSWEVGLRGKAVEDKLSWAVTYFDSDLEDEINGFVFDPVTFGFTADNVDGESERSGVELELSYAPSPEFDVRASYTYIDSTQEDATGDVTEVRRPENSASLVMNYRWEKAGMNLAVSYTGEQEDDFFPPFPPFRERVELDSFTLISVNGYYTINEQVTLTARLENVTDEDYEQVFGFESAGFGGYLGVRLSL